MLKPYSKLLSLFMVKFKPGDLTGNGSWFLLSSTPVLLPFITEHFGRPGYVKSYFQLSLVSKSENFLELLCCWLCQVVLQQVSVLGRHPNVLASGTTICLSLARLFLSPCTQAMEEVECLSVSAWITLLVLLGSKYLR